MHKVPAISARSPPLVGRGLGAGPRAGADFEAITCGTTPIPTLPTRGREPAEFAAPLKPIIKMLH